MTISVLESLIGLTGYPIPMRTVLTIAIRRGLDIEEQMELGEATEALVSRPFRLAEADLLMWLYRAPNVSQGGQSYNFTDTQREDFRRRAQAIYDSIGGSSDRKSNVRYGYKGSRL